MDEFYEALEKFVKIWTEDAIRRERLRGACFVYRDLAQGAVERRDLTCGQAIELRFGIHRIWGAPGDFGYDNEYGLSLQRLYAVKLPKSEVVNPKS